MLERLFYDSSSRAYPEALQSHIPSLSPSIPQRTFEPQVQDQAVLVFEPFEMQGLLSRLERVKAEAGRVVVTAWMPREVYTLENELDIFEAIARLESKVQLPIQLDLSPER